MNNCCCPAYMSENDKTTAEKEVLTMESITTANTPVSPFESDDMTAEKEVPTMESITNTANTAVSPSESDNMTEKEVSTMENITDITVKDKIPTPKTHRTADMTEKEVPPMESITDITVKDKVPSPKTRLAAVMNAFKAQDDDNEKELDKMVEHVACYLVKALENLAKLRGRHISVRRAECCCDSKFIEKYQLLLAGQIDRNLPTSWYLACSDDFSKRLKQMLGTDAVYVDTGYLNQWRAIITLR